MQLETVCFSGEFFITFYVMIEFHKVLLLYSCYLLSSSPFSLGVTQEYSKFNICYQKGVNRSRILFTLS